jgi:hypothetical protein
LFPGDGKHPQRAAGASKTIFLRLLNRISSLQVPSSLSAQRKKSFASDIGPLRKKWFPRGGVKNFKLFEAQRAEFLKFSLRPGSAPKGTQ